MFIQLIGQLSNYLKPFTLFFSKKNCTFNYLQTSQNKRTEQKNKRNETERGNQKRPNIRLKERLRFMTLYQVKQHRPNNEPIHLDLTYLICFSH